MPCADTTPTDDRRQLRSADPVIALGRLLDAARHRTGARALAVADASGLLIAGAGHIRHCEELAALAAAEGWASDGRARTALVRGLPVLVCAQGVTSEAQASTGAALDDVATGAARILASA